MSIYINGYDRQKVMDQIKARNLGYRAFDYYKDECYYRASDGNCCLVGCFIPDELYDSKIEGNDAIHAIKYLELENHMPLSNRLMNRLQELHDGSTLEDLDKEDFYKAIEERLAFFEEQRRYNLI